MAKKWLVFCLAVCLLMPLIAGCGEIVTRKEDGKVHVITTLFPYYDFMRQIGGDNIDLQLIVPAGMDTHSFEPTARDMVQIGEADLFLYNGGSMEHWVPQVLEATEGKDVKTMKMMDYVNTVAEETVEGMQSEEEEEAELDEHIWTSPLNCVTMVDTMTQELCRLDAAHAGEYKRNAAAYKEQLKQLDMEIRKVVAGGRRTELVFGDRFPIRYFTDAYGLSYRAAFPGCGSDMEPSAETIAYLVDRVDEEKIPVVLQVEMSSSKIAETIAESTDAAVMTFSSCHTVTKEQLDKGVTYISLMNDNLEVLKKCLY